MKVFGRILLLSLFPSFVFAQGSQDLLGREGANPITVAVPFAGLAPDSRSSGMGDVGVATSPDAYSVHWNNAKLAFIDTDLGFSFSYSPWLGNIVDDMSLNYLTFYKRINNIQTIGASFRYFDLGEIQLTDINGLPEGIENPREAALDFTYSRKLTDKLGIGVTGRFIWSNLTGNSTGAVGVRTGTSVAVDVGAYYKTDLNLPSISSDIAFGAHISNVGQKITYTNQSNEDFIPANFRLGTAWTGKLDPYNSVTVALDFNKLLVPTPPEFERNPDGSLVLDQNGDPQIAAGEDPNRPLISGTFGSFTDAPGGFSEELQEIIISGGVEYWYRELFAARAGYFYEHQNKGDRKYFTLGIGLRYQVFGFDFSYLVPQEQNHPLGDTLRISFLFNFNKKEKESDI